MKLLLVFFITTALFVCTLSQACTNTPSEHVCKISALAQVREWSPSCASANNAESPLGITATGGPTQAECIDMINGDGSRCVWSYARLQCSDRCAECITGSIVDNGFICGSRCTETTIRCPTAKAAGCFAAIFQYCVGDNQPCSNIGVNKDIIDISNAASNPGQRK